VGSRTEFLKGQLPLFLPESNWIPPSELPDLRNKVREIAIDTETRDDSLSSGRGPGWAFGSTKICGVSAAWDGGAFYAPLSHVETSCLDRDNVTQWLIDHFKTDIRFIFHNAPYDLGTIQSDLGVKLPKFIDDTTAMAVMIDENRTGDHPYSLDSIAHWLGFPGKDETLLKEACAAFGYKDIKKNLWRLPGRYVGPYAEQDAVQTLQISKILRNRMEEEEVTGAYQLEMDLIPLTLEMRRRGIRIDLNLAEKSRDMLVSRRNLFLKDLSEKLGEKISMVEINSARSIEKWFDKENLPFERTPKSKQGKFDSDWLEKQSHWLPRSITAIREIEIAQSKFLQGFMIDYAHKGRIHASINQFKGEEGGTRSHRFSYSDPPLQQMYARSPTPSKEEFVAIIRGCFLPEKDEYWCSVDFSQQEYRLIVHFSELLKCTKANIAGDMYRNDPSTDFHELASKLTKLDRSKAKDVNFAKAFGAGVKKFALMTGMSLDEAEAVMNQYDQELPFVKEAANKCQEVSDKRGYIRLIDGARSHFDYWEVAYRELDGYGACSLEEALRRVEDPSHPWKGRIVRAGTHKAFNRLIQGSAARQTKRAMKMCWDEGIVPLIQMHDELALSLHDPKKGAKMAQLMREAVQLTVPLKTDEEYGISWGTSRKIKDKNKAILYDASWDAAVRLRKEGKWW